MAGQPARPSCAGRPGRGDDQPHLRPARRLRVARALRRGLPAGAGDGSTCCSSSAGRRGAGAARPPRLAGSPAVAARRARADGRRRGRPPALATAGQVGAGRPDARARSTRCGARSSGATSSPTRSSRWSPRRGSPAAATGTAVAQRLAAVPGRHGSGRGVWCETYWLPEADLVELRDGVTVNRGCVVQTHLFHDRVLSMDRVTCGPARRSGPTA